jgi:threonine aldolase
MEKIIDLRSDTVTKPSPEMRKAMYEAEVGDDVYKEDPTVNKLQEYVAELFGKEASLFVPSGVMANQISLNVLTSPGDEIICEKDAHIFHYESGSPAALSGVQLYPVTGKNGIMNAGQVEEAIRPKEAYYMPRTKVIEIENTHNRAGGVIQPVKNIAEIKKLADKHKLKMHLDGARIWNASVASGIPIKEYASYFDSVSACFSKGLGAPVGSIIVGSKDFIKEAFRVRKAWGGGMRQVGVLAAAALFAVRNNIERLKEDHEKARQLARAMSEMKNIEVNLETVQTNIIIFKIKKFKAETFSKKLAEKGVLISPAGKDTLRAVTHLDVSYSDIYSAIEKIEEVQK